jgi:hypothetical protein
MPIGRRADYRIETSWDGSGTYDGPLDNVTPDVDGDAGLTITRGRDQARGRGLARVATTGHTLRNDHRRYSAGGSELSQYLLPGRPHRIGASYGDAVLMDDPVVTMDSPTALMNGRATQYLFTGSLDDIQQRPNLGERRVTVNALGSLNRLRGVRVSTPLYQNITTGQFVVYLFQAGGLTSDQYEVDQDMIDNGRTLAYAYADNDDLYDIVSRIVLDTEGYPAYHGERGDGVIEVQGRNYRSLTPRCLEVQAVFWDRVTSDAQGNALMDDPNVMMDDTQVFMDGGGYGLYHVGFRYTPGLRDVVNDVSQEVVIRAAQSSGTVWTYGQAVTLDDAGEATVTAKPNDPFLNAVTPSTGGGDFSLSGGSVSVALSRTSGGSTEIQFTGGSPGATVNDLRLRAQAFTATSTVRVRQTLDTVLSQQNYGVRSAQLNGWPGLTVLEAESLCDGVAFAYGDPRPLIELDVVNGDGAHLQQIMTLEPSSRIRAVDRHTGVSLELTIEQITHRVTTGRIHRATYACEKVVISEWARYDISLYDSLDAIYGQ